MARADKTSAERAVHEAGLNDEALIKRIDALARLLDTRFSIFGFRFGVDGLVGLIPGIGDAATGILSLYLILEAARAGAPLGLLGRMVVNVLIDMLLGIVPLVGDIFDFAFRANAANAKLLHEYLLKQQQQ